MSALEALLEVQDHDTAVDRLHHRRAHLPERAELVAELARTEQVRALLSDVQARRDEVLGRQSQLETKVGAADQRITEIEGRLYSGQVSATRDILAMTAEVESLKARRSSLEDEMLATMEEEEPLSAEVARLEQEIAARDETAGRLRALIAEAEREIDAELESEARARADRAGSVDHSVLATYEKLRSQLGGVGAARLVGQSCSGCHLILPSQELARIKREPPDALVHCDQCGRILVR